MYPDSKLHELANQVSRTDPVKNISKAWNIPDEIAFDLVKLALYDIVFLLDDSGSMRFGDGLIDELKFILSSVAFAGSLFDQDGFSVRFMNSDVQGDNIRTEQQAIDLVNKVRFEDMTPLATSLKYKILEPFIFDAATKGTLNKPVMVIIITDGRVRHPLLSCRRCRLKSPSPQTIAPRISRGPLQK
jgi:hypothetical protein